LIFYSFSASYTIKKYSDFLQFEIFFRFPGYQKLSTDLSPDPLKGV
jgi:hypothetical protein